MYSVYDRLEAEYHVTESNLMMLGYSVQQSSHHKQCSVHLHVHHRFSFCTWCCKTLGYPSHLHPQLPHPPNQPPPPPPQSSLQLYVHLTLKVLFLGVFYMVNYSITWEETLANLCSALTGIKLITFLSKASTTELNDWVHTNFTM